MLDPSDKMVDVYSCSKCSHQTESAFQLDHHIQRNHKNIYATVPFHAIIEPEQFSCICLNLKSSYQIELYEHFQQAHNPKTENNGNFFIREGFARYPCEHCEYESNSSLSLAKHHNLCEKVPLPRLRIRQDLTNKAVESQVFLKSNMPTRDSSVKVDTLKWTNRAKRKSNLKQANNEKIGWIKCDHCSYRAKYRCKLKMHHVFKHAANEEITWFQCDRCTYRAKQMSCLKKHMLKHASDDEISWFKCNHCSYQSKTKPHLKRHMMQHATNEEISWVQCDRCSYRTKQKANLNTHMLQHATDEEIDWFKCGQCSYRAKRKHRLKQHMLSHATDEEIAWFQCEQCSYRAKRNSRLRQHALRHATDEEIIWFECSQCSYRAKVRPELKKHMLRRHGTKLGKKDATQSTEVQ